MKERQRAKIQAALRDARAKAEAAKGLSKERYQGFADALTWVLTEA